MANKIVGWVLLAVGVLVIVWGIWSSVQIFTAKKPVPEVFKPQQVEKVATPEKKSASPEEQMQQQIQNVIGEQIGNLLPADSMTGILNLVAWSIFMTILIFAGSRIATIGVKLLATPKEPKAKD